MKVAYFFVCTCKIVKQLWISRNLSDTVPQKINGQVIVITRFLELFLCNLQPKPVVLKIFVIRVVAQVKLNEFEQEINIFYIIISRLTASDDSLLL